jgi:hypothetical protein
MVVEKGIVHKYVEIINACFCNFMVHFTKYYQILFSSGGKKMSEVNLKSFFEKKISEAITQFERTIDCKHTEFDTLYPYMSEQPQFFWYKRYVAWQELLTIVKLSTELDVDWEYLLTEKQAGYVRNKVLDAKVLDYWYDDVQRIKNEEESSFNEY